MHSIRVSGIAIVDDNWVLCGCFSASDLRVLLPLSVSRRTHLSDVSLQGITVESFYRFNTTVLDFVQEVVKTVRELVEKSHLDLH